MGLIKRFITEIEETRQEGAAAIMRLGEVTQQGDADVALHALDVIYAELLDLLPTVGPDEPDEGEEEGEEPPDTGHTLHVTLGDGTALEIPNVDEFVLVVDATNEWPVGWQQGEDEKDTPKAGYWDSEAEWRPFDDRHRPRGIVGGW